MKLFKLSRFELHFSSERLYINSTSSITYIHTYRCVMVAALGTSAFLAIPIANVKHQPLSSAGLAMPPQPELPNGTHK